MLCDKCKSNQATVQVYVNNNGYATLQHLCESCAAKTLKANKHFFSNFFGSNEGILKKKSKAVSCEICKTQEADFLESGFVGCSQCYSTFKPQIEQALLKIQGSCSNKAKPLIATPNDEIAIKTKQLQQAVKDERFEDAARLKAEITALKSKRGQGEL